MATAGTSVRNLKRLVLVGVFIAVPIWIGSQIVTVAHPKAGPWHSASEMEAAEFQSFAQISAQQNRDHRQGQHLRFLFSWPWHKSVTFTERPDGGADVMLTELLLTPEGKIKGSEAVREFTLGASEYRDFLAAFDQATAGYRFGFDLLTYDGLEIGYERWNDGQASHYKGNASDYRQDFTAMSLVLQLIRRHGGFAQDRYPDRFGD